MDGWMFVSVYVSIYVPTYLPIYLTRTHTHTPQNCCAASFKRPLALRWSIFAKGFLLEKKKHHDNFYHVDLRIIHESYYHYSVSSLLV